MKFSCKKFSCFSLFLHIFMQNFPIVHLKWLWSHIFRWTTMICFIVFRHKVIKVVLIIHVYDLHNWNSFLGSKYRNESEKLPSFLHFPYKKFFSLVNWKTSYAGNTVYDLQYIHSIQTAAKRYCWLLNRKNEQEKERKELLTQKLTLYRVRQKHLTLF